MPALLCLLTASACSTASSPRKPEFVTAQCPRPEVRIDRSFATAAPVCVETIAQLREAKGDSYLSVAANALGEARTRDICLAEVAKWIKSEREARTTGAPGA